MTSLALQIGDFGRILVAIKYATVAHAQVDQLRDYSSEPYVVHPIEVVQILSTVTSDPETLIAGALHDVAEDTKRSNADIRKRFGGPVAELVAEVTNPETPKGLDRAERKAMAREHIAKASARGQDIKCADVASNVNTGENNLAVLDPEFAAVYLPEKRDAMAVMTKADPQLWKLAMNRIQEGLDILEAQGVMVKPHLAKP